MLHLQCDREMPRERIDVIPWHGGGHRQSDRLIGQRIQTVHCLPLDAGSGGTACLAIGLLRRQQPELPERLARATRRRRRRCAGAPPRSRTVLRHARADDGDAGAGSAAFASGAVNCARCSALIGGKLTTTGPASAASRDRAPPPRSSSGSPNTRPVTSTGLAASAPM